MNWKINHDYLSTTVSGLLILAVAYAISLVHWVLGIIFILVACLYLIHNTRQDDK